MSVLFVDDDASVRDLLRTTMGMWGVDSVFASSGREALQRLAEDNDIDMVITDLTMPGYSGIELAQQILRNGYSVRLIAMSGEYDPHPPERLFERLLQKPFDLRVLQSVIGGHHGPKASRVPIYSSVI
ncbi:MAG: response regulator [Planctomycetota bacterium]|jgi:two-component system NtrC family sensor kinase